MTNEVESVELPYLPDEIWEHVFQYLQEPKDWLQYRTLCRQWKRTIDTAGFSQIEAIGISAPTRECTPQQAALIVNPTIRDSSTPVIPPINTILSTIGVTLPYTHPIYYVSHTLESSIQALVFLWRRATKCQQVAIQSLDYLNVALSVHENSPFEYFVFLINFLNEKWPRPITQITYQPFMSSNLSTLERLVTPWLQNLTRIDWHNAGHECEKWIKLLSQAKAVEELSLHIGPAGPHTLHEQQETLDFLQIHQLINAPPRKTIHRLELQFCDHVAHHSFNNIENLATTIASMTPVTTFEIALPILQNQETEQVDWLSTIVLWLWTRNISTPFLETLEVLSLGSPSKRIQFTMAYQVVFPKLRSIQGCVFSANLVTHIYGAFLQNVIQQRPTDLTFCCQTMQATAYDFLMGMSALYSNKPEHQAGSPHPPAAEEIVTNIQSPWNNTRFTTIQITTKNPSNCSYTIWIPVL
jgi:hypothetical protein